MERTPWHSYGVSFAIWDHTLFVTCHLTQVNILPALTTGTWFTYPGGMEGWVDLGDLLHVDRSQRTNHYTMPPQYIAVSCIHWCVANQISLDLPTTLPDRPWLAIACFLVDHGADLDAVDIRGNTPISHLKNDAVIDLLRKRARSATAYL